MPLTPIGDIGVANLTEQEAAGTTLTWSTFADWEAGTNADTQGYDGSFSDFPTDDLTILIMNARSTLSSFGAGSNPSGVTHDPSGDGGNGSIINTADGDTQVYIRDQAGNQLSSFNTNASGPKGCGYFPSGDGGNGSIFVANDTEPNELQEYSKSGSTLNQYSPSGIGAYGCATDNQYVYMADDVDVYQVDPSDGSVVTSWSHGIGTQVGLGYSGHFLLVTDPGAGDLYVFEKDAGTQLFAPAGMSEKTIDTGKGGDTIFAYGSMWFVDRGANTVYEMSPGYPVKATTEHTTTTKTN